MHDMMSQTCTMKLNSDACYDESDMHNEAQFDACYDETDSLSFFSNEIMYSTSINQQNSEIYLTNHS